MTATTLMLLAFFYLFYGPLVSRLAVHPVMGTLLHVIGHAVVTLALGAVAYRLTLADMGTKDLRHDVVARCVGLCHDCGGPPTPAGWSGDRHGDEGFTT